jgi:CheY-like chemotaxis protein
VLINLCTNGAHAMKGQLGTLTVRYEDVRLPQPKVAEGGLLKPGDYARLTVTDTGHGIPAENLKRIFDPFFTTKGPGEGTGLGLSVVHGIVLAHEGAITVASKPGEGTTFEIYLPILTDGTPLRPGTRQPPIRGHGERLLLVDDEPELRSAAQRALERLGYRVTPAHNPEAALKIFRDAPTGFDAVITDLTMPGMTGTALAAELHRLRPELPILLTTGFGGDLTAETTEATGIRSIVSKPLSLGALASAVAGLFSPPAPATDGPRTS